MNRTRLATLLGALFGCVLLTAGCANLPDSSAPQALGTISREPTSTGPHPPVRGQDPDLLLHDFMNATADPAGNHQTARQYLTPDATQNWDDTAQTIIVDKPDTLRESRTDDTATYRVRARKLGELGADGSFRAQDNTYDTRIEMTKVGDDWRISQLEPGVVVDSSAFYKSYHRNSLYFANGPGTMMVPDPRWTATGKEQLTQDLTTLLAAGPREGLAPAVRNLLAEPVSLRDRVTKANGATDNVGVGLGGVRMDFAGASALDPHSRELLGAQVVLTLSGAGILGPYVLLADGKPLDERYAANGWTLEDVNALNPMVRPDDRVGLHALRDGALVKVVSDKGKIGPTPGYFGSVHNLRAAGLSQDGQLVAAVADSGEPAPAPKQTLVIGSYDGATTFSVVQGDTFTRPSWTADGGAVWTVIDGSRVIRVGHDRGTGNVFDAECRQFLAHGGRAQQRRFRTAPAHHRSAYLARRCPCGDHRRGQGVPGGRGRRTGRQVLPGLAAAGGGRFQYDGSLHRLVHSRHARGRAGRGWAAGEFGIHRWFGADVADESEPHSAGAGGECRSRYLVRLRLARGDAAAIRRPCVGPVLARGTGSGGQRGTGVPGLSPVRPLSANRLRGRARSSSEKPLCRNVFRAQHTDCDQIRSCFRQQPGEPGPFGIHPVDAGGCHFRFGCGREKRCANVSVISATLGRCGCCWN